MTVPKIQGGKTGSPNKNISICDQLVKGIRLHHVIHMSERSFEIKCVKESNFAGLQKDQKLNAELFTTV